MTTPYIPWHPEFKLNYPNDHFKLGSTTTYSIQIELKMSNVDEIYKDAHSLSKADFYIKYLQNTRLMEMNPKTDVKDKDN